MSITLAFVAFDRGINIEKLSDFAFVVPFKTFALDVIPMWRVWVLGLLNYEEAEVLNALDFKSKLLVL